MQNATDNHHREGGLVVMASTLERAREEMHHMRQVPLDCEAFVAEPDFIYNVTEAHHSSPVDEAGVIAIFPDTGCCL